MKLKLTYPVKIGDREYKPGETIDAAEDVAKLLLTNEWAIKIAEEKKHGKRSKRSEIL